MLKLSVTYQVWTPDDLEAGEPSDTGFVFQDVEHTAHELAHLITRKGFIYPSETHGIPRWPGTEGDTNYRTGDNTVKNLHPGDDKQSQRVWAQVHRIIFGARA